MLCHHHISVRGAALQLIQYIVSNSVKTLIDIFDGFYFKRGLLAWRGCPGAITFSGYSARTGEVEGVLCDSPVYNPEPGEITSNEIVAVTREKTEEHGESSNPSGEQDS